MIIIIIPVFWSNSFGLLLKVNSKRISDLCRIFANHFSLGAKIFALIFAREQRSGKDAVFALDSGQRWAFPVWGIYVLYTPNPDAPFLPLAE